jgi:ATP-dependent Lon protease
VPLEAVRRLKIANPIVLVDELDKCGDSRHNGLLERALLPFPEPENARAYPDPYVQSDVDLSHVSYVLTANDAAALSGPLRDRLRIVPLPQPAIEHLPQLARAIVADVARERGGDARWFPSLDDGELAIAESLWRGGSVRRLRAIVKRVLARREQYPRN